jgi:hypothetical protein
MANGFNTQMSQPGKIAATVLGLLAPDTVVARTINRDFDKDFQGGVGNGVNVRRPAVIQSRERAYGAGTSITLDNITEPATQVVELEKMLYSAVPVTDEEMEFELEDFARQVLLPQTQALAYAIESEAVALIEQAPTVAGVEWDAADPAKSFVDVREYLRQNSVPLGNLTGVVGTNVAAAILKSDKFRNAAEVGGDDALRDATIGRIAGFTVVESNMVDPEAAYFYHRDAFTMVLRAPKAPEGVAFGASAAANGFAVRWIKDYDAALLADRSILSVFYGGKALEQTIRKADGSTESFLPAIKVLPAS